VRILCELTGEGMEAVREALVTSGWVVKDAHDLLRRRS
jgi:translation elongation factor EF-Ts